MAGWIVLIGAATAACGGIEASDRPGGSGDQGDQRAIRVVTTTTVFADLVKNVGGAHVDVSSIIPPGVGPEDYEPKPNDARSVSGAALIVSNGVGLDDFLEKVLSAGGTSNAERLVLGEGIPAISEDGHANPHFWLDPSLVRDEYVPRILAALVKLAPAAKADLESNAAAYVDQLSALDSELKGEVATIPEADRRLVTFHEAFPYFARHFGFELVGVVLENVGQEPTAAELASLIDTVKAAKVKAVFSEAQFSPKLAETLASEAGITRVVTNLYNDALGPAPADTYLGMMRWNMRQIVDALR